MGIRNRIIRNSVCLIKGVHRCNEFNWLKLQKCSFSIFPLLSLITWPYSRTSISCNWMTYRQKLLKQNHSCIYIINIFIIAGEICNKILWEVRQLLRLAIFCLPFCALIFKVRVPAAVFWNLRNFISNLKCLWSITGI